MNTEKIVLGMGCFWGVEKRMRSLNGVIDAECGYANGTLEETDYEQVLQLEKLIKIGASELRNHAEVVLVTFDTEKTSLEEILIGFWENHDPTQGNRQGNDIGTNYRSGIYTFSDEQQAIAQQTKSVFQKALTAAKYGTITTEIEPLSTYSRAEEYHQKYLFKHPNGYCGLGGIGVSYPRS